MQFLLLFYFHYIVIVVPMLLLLLVANNNDDDDAIAAIAATDAILAISIQDTSGVSSLPNSADLNFCVPDKVSTVVCLCVFRPDSNPLESLCPIFAISEANSRRQ